MMGRYIKTMDYEYNVEIVMSEQLEQALKNLRDLLQHESHEHCVSVSVFFDCQGYNIEHNIRTPEILNRHGIIMRNLRGEWVK